MLELKFPILINMAIFPCYPHCAVPPFLGKPKYFTSPSGVNVPGMSVKFPV